ncbi:MAG TPA: recombinase family protein [Anaerolineales bacterium]|nr:recombinase family protein [Anaerolineales bacterium]
MSDQYSPPPPSLTAGARVWAYLRDSGGPAQEQSIGQQESEIIAYCKRYNLSLVKVFRDVARSGGSTTGRDEFMGMIEQSEDETIRPQAILIWNFARFSRDYNDTVFYKATLQQRGVMVHSVTDVIPVDDFSARIVETVISLANEEKRRQTSRDVKRGLKSLVSKGFSPGIPPRGYVAVKVNIGEKRDGIPRMVSRWEPDPVLSGYVKIAWQLRAEGKSYREITKATKGMLYTSVNTWTTFFKNKSYLGIGKSGDLEITDHHEPLITWELWEAVQKLRKAHPRYGKKGNLNHPRRVGNPTALSGFTYCIECGNMMTHSNGNKNKVWKHYICGKKDRHGSAACKSRRVGAINAETQIIKAVLDHVLTPEYLMEVIDETKKQLDSTTEIERQITAENRKLDDLDIAIQRLLRTIEKTDSPSAQDRLKEREAEKMQARAEIDRLRLQLTAAQTVITPEAIRLMIIAWRDQFEDLQESGNVRDVKAWLMQFVSRVDLGYNKARIFFTYPMIDLFQNGSDNSRNVASPRGGTQIIRGEKSIMVEWR